MQLSTWHKPDFSLLDGRVDHERSEYVQTVAGVREAYRRLAKQLGTEQFIWCYAQPHQHVVVPGRTEVEWVLDVPASEVLAFVDNIIWNRILGIQCALPQNLRLKWKDEAIQLHPTDPTARDRHVEERCQQFWSQAPPSGGWWTELFVTEQSGETVSVLVRHPVPKEWVKHGPTTRSS